MSVPRLVFCAQVLASVVATLSSILAQQWALKNIPDICPSHQKGFLRVKRKMCMPSCSISSPLIFLSAQLLYCTSAQVPPLTQPPPSRLQSHGAQF